MHLNKSFKFFFYLFFFISFFTFQGCKSTPRVYYAQNQERKEDVVTISKDTTSSDESVDLPENRVYVSIYGEVINPGIYILPDYYRVYEAINAAGGVTNEADVDGLNLVAVISSDMRIYVRRAGESTVYENSSFEGSADTDMQSRRININTAGVSELVNLPGIGTGKATAIVKYREENGAFKSCEDIMLVPGIKDGIYNSIKDSICVK